VRGKVWFTTATVDLLVSVQSPIPCRRTLRVPRFNHAFALRWAGLLGNSARCTLQGVLNRLDGSLWVARVVLEGTALPRGSGGVASRSITVLAFLSAPAWRESRRQA